MMRWKPVTYKQNILFLAGLHNELRVKTRMIESKQSFIEICQNEDDLSVSVHHGQGRTVHCWEVKFVSNKLLYGGNIHHTDFLPKNTGEPRCVLILKFKYSSLPPTG